MNIGVNTRMLVENNMTGIGWFIFETMKRIVAKHPEHTFYYFFDRSYSHKFITSPNIVPIVVPPKCRYHPLFYKFWYDFQLPKVLKKYKIDLFISGDTVNTTKSKVPSLLVIHDLTFEHYPSFTPSYMTKYFKKTVPKGANKAIEIATVSEYSKNDIATKYQIDSNKISVVYNGINNHFEPLDNDLKLNIKAQYANNCDYFLFIGTIHPRKNLKNQLLAFDMFKKANNDSIHKFLIVGTKWIWDKELDEAYSKMYFKNDVVFIGHLPTDELSRVTASATALMYVSVFEGFGIPIIEAFESKTPVITSNTSSMPEVAGNAALIVDPFKPEEIFEAMNIIYKDPDTVNRLIENGLNRKELFSWDLTADKFDKVFVKATETINK